MDGGIIQIERGQSRKYTFVAMRLGSVWGMNKQYLWVFRRIAISNISRRGNGYQCEKLEREHKK